MSKIFLYCTPGYDARAYIIKPDDAGDDIQHQYHCIRCWQFEIKATLEEVTDDALCDVLYDALCCNPWPAEAINLKTSLKVAEVLGEGLARLEDGSYIAIENCD